MEMVFEAVEDSAKITCDAENTVESLNGVDEREQISGGIEDRIDVSNRIQMETSSGVKSRLEIVPTNVAMFSTIKEEECRLINPEHNAITIDNSVISNLSNSYSVKLLLNDSPPV